jgi:L-lactate dehydrogenase (cytochrome)/(S)-mandelate dehydrogenase
MRSTDAINIDDLRRLARRRLPKILFDLIESGVGDERGLSRNHEAFNGIRLMPRYLVDVSKRDPSAVVFGRRYALPFGIAPTGFAGLLRPDAELMLAEAAVAADIPLILSGASVASVEAVSKVAPRHTWFHLYAARDPAISASQIRRALAAGIETLVLTVDNPVYPKRERELRNGFRLPLRLKPGILLEALLHPSWIAEYLRSGGMPTMATWAPYAPPGAGPGEIAAFFRSQSPSVQTWRELEGFRRLWPGNLVLKGIQHPDDAARADSVGVDGLIVSNHGGKSFDPLPSPLETLPAIRAKVSPRVSVMLDSGIRRGTDVLSAGCLGASFTFVGRATLYGVVAGGRPGADRAIAILAEEVDIGLAMLGCPRFADLGKEYVLSTPFGKT